MREELLLPAFIQGTPTSIIGPTVQRVIKLYEGPVFAKALNGRQDFWEFHYSWGGQRMWEGIEASKRLPYNMSRVAEGMKNNTLLWVTDGSYDRKKAIDLSRVGRIIFCTKTGFRLTGTFWEKSKTASLYRAEMLGLCALHLLARAVADFHQIKGWSATLCCDNECALELLSHHLHRIRPSAKCANIRCSIKATKQFLQGAFWYVHVYEHMDRLLNWEQLLLVQQLNCVCNTMAKRSITLGIKNGYHDRQFQFLPKEDVALVIWGNKVTGNILPPLRFHASKEVARRHLAMRKNDKWSNECFDAVDWEHLDLALMNKADMYKLWRSKQHLSFLRYKGSGWQILRGTASRQKMSYLRKAGDSSASHALPR